jgi:hypothetical protein
MAAAACAEAAAGSAMPSDGAGLGLHWRSWEWLAQLAERSVHAEAGGWR